VRRLLIPLLLIAAGCKGNDDPVARAAGVYPEGSFAIQSVNGSTDPKLILANEMRGTLWLYATKMKFRMEMKTPQQEFLVEGRWKAEDARVTLTADNFGFTNPSEEDQKAFKLDIVKPEEIRAAFGHALVLDATPDRRKLTGLATSLGKLIGHFEFVRPIPH
jgi:hypothetical protein